MEFELLLLQPKERLNESKIESVLLKYVGTPYDYMNLLKHQIVRTLFGWWTGRNKKSSDNMMIRHELSQTVWDELPARFGNMELDEFCIMPNHIHGAIVFKNRRGESCIRPQPSVGDKSVEHKSVGHRSGDHKDRP